MDNYSQREMAFLTEARRAVDVPIEFVKACKDELAALNLCINLSNLSDETIREKLGIDKGLCGNRAPVQFEALHLNCDLVEKSKDAVIRELERQLEQARKAA
jgi:formiminotetrahydrofolate cyclodeaminase